MKVVGIDPGITGALALHDGGKLTTLEDMPVFDTRVDGAGVNDILRAMDPDAVFIEDTQAMPRNGSIALFKLGLNTGIVIGVVQSLGHPLFRIRPAKWKAKMGVSRLDKNGIRGIVREMYPDWQSCFARVKDHNRAEAVLISRYGVSAMIERANELVPDHPVTKQYADSNNPYTT
jgi:Holliday junction resolvasome RuvABC endonuclease subunit